MLTIFPSKFDSLRRLAKALIREMDIMVRPETVTPINFYREVRSFEVSLILWALAHSDGKQTVAAKMLGIKPTTLNMMIKRYELNVAGRKGGNERSSMNQSSSKPEHPFEQVISLQ